MSADKETKLTQIFNAIQTRLCEVKELVRDAVDLMGEDDLEAIEKVNEILRKNKI